jgi:tetratricopeptide (TPR) repeat protein
MIGQRLLRPALVLNVAAMFSLGAQTPAAPTPSDSLVTDAGTAMARGDTTAAVAALRLALQRDSLHVRAARTLVKYYVDAAQYREAYALGEFIERVQPRNLVARFYYGWAPGYLFDTTRSRAIYERLIADDPRGTYGAWSHGELGYVARAQGNFPAAIRHMIEGRRAMPEDRYLPVGHATMLLTAGDAAGAKAILDSALARDSLAIGFGGLPANLLQAWAARDLGDSSAASTAFRRAEAQLRPRAARGDGQALRYLAAAATLRGQPDSALVLLDKAVDPNLRPYGGPQGLEREGWWGRLLDDPRFKSAIARAVARSEAIRRSVEK